MTFFPHVERASKISGTRFCDYSACSILWMVYKLRECLVLSNVFGRNLRGEKILGRRRKQLPDDGNGKRMYWNLIREHQFHLSGELDLEDAMELDLAMNDYVLGYYYQTLNGGEADNVATVCIYYICTKYC